MEKKIRIQKNCLDSPVKAKKKRLVEDEQTRAESACSSSLTVSEIILC